MKFPNYFHNLSINQKSLLIAAALHILVPALIIIDFANDDAPVLSFSVTMHENVSVSQNNISATTIANVKAAEKKEEIDEEKNEDAEKKIVKKQKKQEERKEVKGDNVTNSKQQEAVFGDAPAVFNASYLNNPAPTYPALSKKLGEQGKVFLNVFVNKDGEVEQISIAKSSGFPRLDSAALNTVRNWRFTPAKKGGKFESSWVEVPINFILEKK